MSHDLSLYDYDLPPERIAQEPCPQRDQARLLVLRRKAEAAPALAHHRVCDLPDLLRPGDLLVLNDTRVVPARLVGRRASTEGKWEGLFVRQLPDGAWELLCQTRGRLRAGETLLVAAPSGGDELRLVLVGRAPEGRWLAQPSAAGSAGELLARYGQVPIPPYIRKGRAGAADRERYQTVYAARPGAVAAPTAGLHFTEPLFAELERRGIGRAFVTLHVGPGTFRPVQAADVTQHRMEAEWGELPAATAEAIAACKARGGRVVAVGTTTVRVLETVARQQRMKDEGGRMNQDRPGSVSSFILHPSSFLTDLTICPPFVFRAVDALLTNFHLPRSSLLLLVAAFAGLEPTRAAYRTAVEQGYRFYSYGDAMLIL
jgi:S-adenosylmethionine:tRNA ribosyltransferase-isomerase